MRAVPRLDAFGGDARSHHLRQTVDVERRQRERALDGLAQPLGPRLGPEDARPEAQAGRIGDMVGDRKRVARGAAEDLGAEILEQLCLARCVPSRRRHDRAAEPLGAVVEAETAGEEAVAVRDVHACAGAGSGRRERPRAAVGPGREIATCVRDDRRLAARSRRGVDTHALLERHLQQAERIRVAQLRLDPERLLRQRLERDSEPLAQPLSLQLLELRARQRLELGLEDRHGADYPLPASAVGVDRGGVVRASAMSIEKAVMTYLKGWTLASQNAQSRDPGACRRR